MNEFLVTPVEMHEAAEAFAKASQDSQAIIDRLEKATAKLEGKWGGVTQQMFYKNYKEWHAHMSGMVELLRRVSLETQAIADRFEQADK